MTTVSDLLIRPQPFSIILIILVIFTLNTYFWHQRQLQVIAELDLRRPGVEPPTQMHQALGVGIIIFSAGVGSLLEVSTKEAFGGSFLLIIPGGAMAIYSYWLLDAAGRNQGDDNSDHGQNE